MYLECADLVFPMRFKQAIMDGVAAREVPVYFEVEEEIISAPSKVCFRVC